MKSAVELDVRRLPTWQRHPKIIAAFEALEPGAELRVISDHEPRPLRADFERRYLRGYVWLQRMLGAEHWEVVVRRVVPGTDRLRDFLQRSAVFADVSEETLDAVEAAAIEKALGHNEAVAEQDGELNVFGIVAHGTLAAVTGLPLGREHQLYEVLAGEAFGEISTIDGGSTAARFVVTSRLARILCIPKDVIRAGLRSDHRFALAMNGLCAQRLRVVIERFNMQAALSTLARVAASLLPHAAPQPGLIPVPPAFTMTQGELATAAGTVTEVVNRSLAVLEEAGAVERGGGHIVKLDREKLSAYARSQ